MLFDDKKNYAHSTVVVAPSPAISGGTLTVVTGEGALFPIPPFNAEVSPPGVLSTVANAEVIRVTSIVGDVLHFTRQAEGSSARTILVGDEISNPITVFTFTQIQDQIKPAPAPFSFPGTLFVSTGLGAWEITQACLIKEVRAFLGMAPTGSAAIFDVLLNGVTVFTTSGNRPTIANGTQRVTSVAPDIQLCAIGDLLSMSIVQVGSTFAGSDLSLKVVLSLS